MRNKIIDSLRLSSEIARVALYAVIIYLLLTSNIEGTVQNIVISLLQTLWVM